MELIASVGAPCWACGPTAAALHVFDDYRLEPPFHIMVPRDRSVNRVGHFVHRGRDITRLDVVEVDGVPTTSATRTIIDLAASETCERLTTAVDCSFAGTNVVVELLGYRFHRTVMQLQNDAERMNRMILEGLHPLQFTYTDVASESPVMLADIREALAGAGVTASLTV